MALTKKKGAIAETKVLAYLIERGFNVSIPWGEDVRYDLVSEKDGVFKRIQIKYVTPKNGCLVVFLRSANNWNTIKYTVKDIDITAVYDPKNDKIYFIPITMFSNNSRINLRLLVPKNNQKKNVIWASEFQDTNVLEK